MPHAPTWFLSSCTSYIISLHQNTFEKSISLFKKTLGFWTESSLWLKEHKGHLQAHGVISHMAYLESSATTVSL